MRYPKRPWRVALIGSVALGTAISMAGAGLAAGSQPANRAALHGFAARQHSLGAALKADAAKATASTNSSGVNSTPDDNDLADQNAQYDFERTAPGAAVSGPALASAEQQASQLPATGGDWRLFTNQPYDAEPGNYTDPFWGNQGAGFSTVSGRVTALVAAPDGAWFLGAADGGVWRSWDQGQHWTPVFDQMATLSIGALAVDPVDGSIWVGTGEANVSQDAYAGTGVYRSFDNGRTWHLVGPVNGFSPMASDSIFRVAFDQRGNAYAATDNGLFRYSARTGQWTEVLDPAGAVDNPPYDQQVTDVAIVPGSHGRDVIAAIGWHGPGNTENNGFYESTDGGHHFSQVTVTGDINTSDIGRTTFAYSADGSKLYAIVQSPAMLTAGDPSVLQGVFVSSGSPASVAGPWTLIGNSSILGASGSALSATESPSYQVGVQAWYNQDIAVDPSNPDHVYIGLEEVFESTNAGSSWITASPYWNYPFACDATSPPTCPNTTHPDQHAMMISDGKIVIGNDGGVYSRPLSDDAEDGQWTDLNASLRTMQYYDARAGSLPAGGTEVWGGMQDNGSAVVSNQTTQMSEAAGGDGFDVVVDPQNGNNIVGEYTDGTMYSSTDGGHSFSDPVSPTCVGQEEIGLTPRSDCDPNARFVTPLIQDQQNPDVWVAGGEFVWVTTAGWNTSCTDSACSWTPVYDTGSGNAVTALSSADNGSIIYAAWVGGGGNPGPTFASGIATNYGGTWHQVSTAGLPDRYIAGMTVDPSNPAHAYAIFNGYSRRWVPGGGVGHVFETWNGGATWTDISGNLPDIASDALVLMHHRLALATDGGVFTAREGEGASTYWSRLGHGLPNAAVDDLTVGPHGYIYAATHGRGVWRFRF
jgi:sugar lactone lactonase YvrE